MAGEQHPKSLIPLNSTSSRLLNPEHKSHLSDQGHLQPRPTPWFYEKDHPLPLACVNIFPLKVPPFQLAHQITTLMEQDGAEALAPPGSPPGPIQTSPACPLQDCIYLFINIFY